MNVKTEIPAHAAEQTLPAGEISDEDLKDIEAIHTYLLGISTGTEVIDINEDGRIDAVDLTLAKRELLAAEPPALAHFTADTWDIYLDEEKTVTFTVQAIDIADAIMLCDAAGNALTEMHDDGENGDEAANDGIFTAQETLSSDAVKNAGFYAAAGELRSDTFEVCFYRDLEEDDFKKYYELAERISEMSFEEAAEYVAQSEDIASYTIDEEHLQIWYQSVFGIHGCVDYTPETEEQTKGFGALAVPDASGRDWTAAASSVHSTTFATSHPGKRDVIVLRSFRNSEFQYDDFKDAGEILADVLGGSLTVVDDTDVDLQQLRELASYGAVLIDSHGTLKNGTTPYIVTGVSLNEDMFNNNVFYRFFHQSYSADYESGRIYCYTNSAGKHRVAVGKEFFDKYYDAGSLDESFWFLGTCDSLYDNTLSDVLISKGAGAVVGYTDTVGTGYCNDTLFEFLINSMVLSGSNVRRGVAEARRIYGTTDPGNSKCELQFRGQRHFKLVKSRYRLYDTGLTWNDAKKYCEILDGHLAVITDADEQAIIEKLLAVGTRNSYWLGGRMNGNAIQWITGEKSSYTNWAPSMPDNAYHPDEVCLMIYRNQNPVFSASTRLKWNDLCNEGTFGSEAFFGLSNMGIICEWD